MKTALHQETIPLTVGVSAGLLHAGITALLWTYFGFENLLSAFATEPLYVSYVILGMFFLGLIPGVLYARYQSVSPLLLVGSLLTLSSIMTWQTIRTGATPVDPTPFGWYVLLWIGIAAGSGLIGGIEITLRHNFITT